MYRRQPDYRPPVESPPCPAPAPAPAAAAKPGPTDSEMAEAFRRLDLSDVPPRMRAWAAFAAGVRLGARS